VGVSCSGSGIKSFLKSGSFKKFPRALACGGVENSTEYQKFIALLAANQVYYIGKAILVKIAYPDIVFAVIRIIKAELSLCALL
jgi:hypothetical protein